MQRLNMKRLLIFSNKKNIYQSVNFVILIIVIIISYSFDLIEYNDVEDINFEELSISENINYPIIPNELHPIIIKVIDEQYNQLKKMGYTVNRIRNNEAIQLTISIDDLFESNSYSKIKDSGITFLMPILKYLKVKQLYRIIISCHHDKSITETEADFITKERVLTLSDWFSSQSYNAHNVIAYYMGNEYPLVSDLTSKGRKRNRRLEIFLIPGKTMIELARENKL